MAIDIYAKTRILFTAWLLAPLLGGCQTLPPLVEDSDTPSGEGEGEGEGETSSGSETSSLDTDSATDTGSETQIESASETSSDSQSDTDPMQLTFVDPSPSAPELDDLDMHDGFFHDVIVEANEPVKDGKICLAVDEKQQRCIATQVVADKHRAVFADVFFTPGTVELLASAVELAGNAGQVSLSVQASHTATTPILREEGSASFYWTVQKGAAWVKLVGSFTDPAWDLAAGLSMTELYPDLWMVVTEPLPSGEHQYLFAWDLEDDWEQDTLNPNRVSDGAGGYNSVFSVTCADAYLDSSTGLWWTKKALAGARIWDSAVSACNNLSLCGETDWRLPTISDLRALIRGCDKTELPDDVCGVTDSCASIGACWDVDCYGCLPADAPGGGCYWPMELGTTCEAHWSSTSDSSDTSYAWTVDFAAAKITGYGKDSTAFTARCVR